MPRGVSQASVVRVFLPRSSVRFHAGTDVNEGVVMAIWTATIIVEPHLLVREALDSLIKNYGYGVVCSVGCTADIGGPSMVGDGPKLVILGAQSADNAITEAGNIRKLWSDSKIVLLFEY